MLNEYPDVLTVKQVAEILHIGLNSAYKLVNEQTIGSRRVGTKFIVPKVCLTDYLNSARYLVSKQ